MNIDNLSLSDLIILKGIIESKLSKKEDWVNSERGLDYNEYCKREHVYDLDENHLKIKLINEKIDFITK